MGLKLTKITTLVNLSIFIFLTIASITGAHSETLDDLTERLTPEQGVELAEYFAHYEPQEQLSQLSERHKVATAEAKLNAADLAVTLNGKTPFKANSLGYGSSAPQAILPTWTTIQPGHVQ
jgi:hypothetical protein